MANRNVHPIEVKMKNSKTILIDKNPGRNSQTYGIARELGTDLALIHEPSVADVILNIGAAIAEPPKLTSDDSLEPRVIYTEPP